MPGAPISLFTVDAFTDLPFAGNPAAVVILGDLGEIEPAEPWMQQVAAEMNLSETAFLVRDEDDSSQWGLRWFTPTVEVELCGHATLAAAHVLYEQGLVDPGTTIQFLTRSGVLSAVRAGAGMVALDFPAEPVTESEPPPGLLEALGLRRAVWVGQNRFDALVEVDDAATVRKLTPDLAAIAGIDLRGVIVTARGEEDGVDFVSRFFGPAVGVPEDPVTGSAHCALGPYWAPRLGATALQGRQLSRRGGLVAVQVRGDRVTLAGQAVTVLRGVLAAPAGRPASPSGG